MNVHANIRSQTVTLQTLHFICVHIEEMFQTFQTATNVFNIPSAIVFNANQFHIAYKSFFQFFNIGSNRLQWFRTFVCCFCIWIQPLPNIGIFIIDKNQFINKFSDWILLQRLILSGFLHCSIHFVLLVNRSIRSWVHITIGMEFSTWRHFFDFQLFQFFRW